VYGLLIVLVALALAGNEIVRLTHRRVDRSGRG